MRVGKYLQAPSVLLLATIASGNAIAADVGIQPDDALATHAESRISVGVSSYYYYIPDLDLTFTGQKGSIGYYGTLPLGNEFFGLLDVDYRFGPATFGTSLESIDGIPESYVEGKIALGRDLLFDNFVVSPYIGLGYRNLFNELSTVIGGVDAMTQYFYIPVGLIHRIDLGADASLETTLEGDIFLVGYRQTDYADYDPNWGVSRTQQNTGYGIKASMMYRKDQWGIGPYLNYWNVAKSDSGTYKCNDNLTCSSFVPENSTTEYGIEMQLSSWAAPTMQSNKRSDNDSEAYSSLKTSAESRISFGLSNYDYYEPREKVTFGGPKGSIGYFGTLPLGEEFFGLLDVDYHFGAANYKSPAYSDDGISDYYVEGKIALGRDFRFDNFVVSPYIGFGYRRLFDEFGSVSNGYDRTSQYLYLPVGFIHRIRLGSDARLETTVEGDILLIGYQKSEFSQLAQYGEDLHNTQDKGYGIKASMMYRRDKWGIGPYLNYWSIADSSLDTIRCGEALECDYFEPASTTTEYGIELEFSSTAVGGSYSDSLPQREKSDWSGLYAGIQGTYDLNNIDESSDFLGDGTIILGSSTQFSGAALGIFVGSNYSSSNAIVGVEFDANLTDASLNGDSVTVNGQSMVGVENFYDLNGYGSGRLRLGYNYGRLMPFVTAGVALANIEVGSDFTQVDYQLEGSDWAYGYTLGAGAEYRINDTFRMRAEYRYSDFGTTDIKIKTGDEQVPKTTYEVDMKTQALTVGLGMVF